MHFYVERIRCKCRLWLPCYSSLAPWLCGKESKVDLWGGDNTLQPRFPFNSGKYDQIFPVVFLRQLGHFSRPSEKESAAHRHGSRPDYVSTAWHWLRMHILESPVKLLARCLYRCFVSPVEHQPALGKVHAKSIRFLGAFLLEEQLPPFSPVAPSWTGCQGNSVIVAFFIFWMFNVVTASLL